MFKFTSIVSVFTAAVIGAIMALPAHGQLQPPKKNTTKGNNAPVQQPIQQPNPNNPIDPNSNPALKPPTNSYRILQKQQEIQGKNQASFQEFFQNRAILNSISGGANPLQQQNPFMNPFQQNQFQQNPFQQNQFQQNPFMNPFQQNQFQQNPFMNPFQQNQFQQNPFATPMQQNPFANPFQQQNPFANPFQQNPFQQPFNQPGVFNAPFGVAPFQPGAFGRGG